MKDYHKAPLVSVRARVGSDLHRLVDEHKEAGGNVPDLIHQLATNHLKSKEDKQ